MAATDTLFIATGGWKGVTTDVLVVGWMVDRSELVTGMGELVTGMGELMTGIGELIWLLLVVEKEYQMMK